MMHAYTQNVLRVAVSQICQTIGWHSTHTTTMDLLINVTQHFLREISHIMHRYCELYNRTEPNLDDLALAYIEIGINLHELMEYIQFVDPIPLPLQVPRFPLPKESNLNFLKPGSREVLMRPVHIPEYMPPIHFEKEEDAIDVTGNEEDRLVVYSDGRGLAATKSILSTAAVAIATAAAAMSADATTSGIRDNREPGIIETVGDGSTIPDAVINEEVEIPMQTTDVKEHTDGTDEAAKVTKLPEQMVKDKQSSVDETAASKNGSTATEEGRPTREISSVIMTTSGFISPAREGKLPESRIPIIAEERPLQQSGLPMATLSSIASSSHVTPAMVAGTSSIGLSAHANEPSSGMAPSALSSIFLAKSNAAGDSANTTSASGATDLPSAVAKGGGEKPKRVKKKPTDREKKKAEKNNATSSRKAEKTVGGKGAAKPNIPEGVTSMGLPAPATSTMAEGALLPPFEPGSKVEPNDPNSFPAGDPSTLGRPNTTGKPNKPPKTKAGKEKALKKRKSAAVPPDTAPLFGVDIPMPTTTASQAKPKRSQKASKKSTNQRGQFPEPIAGLPPPLIGPLGLGTPLGGGGSVTNPMQPLLTGGENTFATMVGSGAGCMPTSTTATLCLPIKKSGSPKGSSKPGESNLSGMVANPPVDQVAQLNMLQMMHPSLEITASPAPSTQEVSQNPVTHGKRPLETKTTVHDRDVIVIDDDQTPPHVPSAHPVAATGSKKQRKQQAQQAQQMSAVPADGWHRTMGLELADAGKMHAKPLLNETRATGLIGPLGCNYSPPRAGELAQPSFRDFPSPQTLGGLPKTPDMKLQSPWLGDSGRMTTPTRGTGNLFAELSSPTLTECMTPGKSLDTGPGSETVTGKKPKRAKQKQKGEPKRGKQPVNQPSPEMGAGKNPFAIFPNPIGSRMVGPFGADPAAYSKYLNQSLQAVTGMRNPMPFGLFPLSSGPGLIPDNPLFPRLPAAYPGQPRPPGFHQIGPNPFNFAGMNPMNNLLRMPLTTRHPMVGLSGGVSGHPHDFLDEPLDPETKLAQTPLDLQKSTCNVAPLAPASLFQSAVDGIVPLTSESELLNLSVKSTAASSFASIDPSTPQLSTAKKETVTAAAMTLPSSSSTFGPGVGSTLKDDKPETTVRDAYKEDQVVILPAASVLPGASPSQRSNMLVIDIDDSDGSQSTATTGGKSKDGKRKPKDHKKDRKVKEGKIKKKKDKKDKSKGKDRDREQLKELTAGTATSSGMMTMGMIGAEEALMEQLRKERKEKKEKRKEKVKKEKRKERDRFGGNVTTVSPSTSLQLAKDANNPPFGGETVPKLMLKIGGSNATQSPRSEITDRTTQSEQQHLLAMSSLNEPKRDGSPELARISALVTRPPKLKATGTGGGKSKKDDGTGKSIPVGGQPVPAGGSEHSKLQAFEFETDDGFSANKPLIKSGAAAGSAAGIVPLGANVATLDDNSAVSTSGIAAGRASKAARNTTVEGASTELPNKSFLGGEMAKKSTKEPKASKSVHHHHAALDTLSTPAHMTDVDGNTVWICPACGRVDDGTPMIGCDGCDAWYHWVCVGIQVPPDDNEDWYCRVCIGKKQDSQSDEKQRKRKKKDKKASKD